MMAAITSRPKTPKLLSSPSARLKNNGTPIAGRVGVKNPNHRSLLFAHSQAAQTAPKSGLISESDGASVLPCTGSTASRLLSQAPLAASPIPDPSPLPHLLLAQPLPFSPLPRRVQDSNQPTAYPIPDHSPALLPQLRLAPP